ncbi:glycosyltransferase family 2 protein [Cerasicoccus fimbriatus]|uniref:glycosyltransferase family 2 protein n=1 Tax=Cerasicoccus fimbriatus TaxID=3014554 RepID=UPI0022B2E19E|nr:glycosyltransferase family 2 protein [Cerasicoccus sp. TK19100]
MATDIPVFSQRNAWPFSCPVSVESAASAQPDVSVIIPSYNQGEFLEAAIRSVLCQTHPSVECIVLDAGSTDQSRDIIDHYSGALAHWRSHPDDGQSAAINEGASVARGRYVSFLNSDDMLAPDAASNAVQSLNHDANLMLVHGHRILIDAHDRIAGWTCSRAFDPEKNVYTINSETAFWRREVFYELGGFNAGLKFALDLDFFCRIYQKHPIKLLNRFMGYYRFHPQSKSETLNDICQDETKACWLNIFGKEYLPHQAPTPTMRDKVRHFSLGIQNPGMVLIPYIKDKLIR